MEHAWTHLLYYQYLLDSVEEYRRNRARGMPGLYGRIGEALQGLAHLSQWTGDKLMAYDRAIAPEWVDYHAPLPPILIGPFGLEGRRLLASAVTPTANQPQSVDEALYRRDVSLQVADNTQIAKPVQPGRGLRQLLVSVPDDSPARPVVAEQLMQGLYQLGQFTCFIEATPQQILFGIEVFADDVDSTTETIANLYPHAEIVVQPKTEVMTQAFQFTLETAIPYVCPLRHASEIKNAPALRRVVQPMARLKPHEQMRYELRFNLPRAEYTTMADDLITESVTSWQDYRGEGVAEVTQARITGANRVLKAEYQGIDLAVWQDKLDRPLLEARLAVKIKAASRDRAEALFLSLCSGTNLLAGPGRNRLFPAEVGTFGLVLAPPESAALFHLPSWQFEGPIVWASGSAATPSRRQVYDPAQGLGEPVRLVSEPSTTVRPLPTQEELERQILNNQED